MKIIEYIKEFSKGKEFGLMILIAVLIALMTSALGLKLYNMSDVSRLDLSLPGHEKSRESIGTEERVTFDANGPVDSKSLDDFQKLFDDKRAAMNALHKFDGDLLNTDSLKITTNL